METRLAYFDEAGDDGLNGSAYFILSNLYMPSSSWQTNFNRMMGLRRSLKDDFGFHVQTEMHTKQFLLNKPPYSSFKWTDDQRLEIIERFITCVGGMDAKSVSVIIDKKNISKLDFPILTTAFKYNIQRVENDSRGEWNYIIIVDNGRIGPMKKTVRAIRADNPIYPRASKKKNTPIEFMIEDVFDKDSTESAFIQVADMITYFVHLYYNVIVNKNRFPGRINPKVNETFIKKTMNYLKKNWIFNLDASRRKYGLIVYREH
jgi:hypothetical protein